MTGEIACCCPDCGEQFSAKPEGGHRLLCGDATSESDVKRVLNGVTPHLMITDPPYGVEYDPKWRDELGIDWTGQQEKKTQRRSTHSYAIPISTRSLGKVNNDDRCDWREVYDLFPGNIAYVWHGGLHAGVVAESLVATRFSICAQIIWVKQHFVFSRGDYHWQHEPCWYAVRGSGDWRGDRSQSTVWQIANASAFHGNKDDQTTKHGAQKPVECMRRPIENNSSPGQAVYDPFVGSGTSIIAAEQTGRACYALEIAANYTDVCIKRWQKFTGQRGVLDGDGRTFDEIAAERLASIPGSSTPVDSIAAE